MTNAARYFIYLRVAVPPLALILLLALLLPPVALCAEGEGIGQRVSLSAFGSLGLVYDSSRTHLQRDFGQQDTFHGRYSYLTDSLLGAQLDVRLATGFDATVQMVAKDRVEQSLDESLEWAFLRWQPLQELTLRAGRLGMDFYLLSDYRNVGIAYLWQRPVVEFYGPLMIQNFDGGDLRYSFKAGQGRVHAKLFGGVTRHSLKVTGENGVSTLDFAPVLGATIGFENDQFRLVAGYAHATFGESLSEFKGALAALRSVPPEVWPDASRMAGSIGNQGRHVSYYSLGACYDAEDWVVQGEAGYLQSDWGLLRDIASGYLSVGRHFGDVTPYLVLARAKTLGAMKNFSAPAATGDPGTDAGLAQLSQALNWVGRGIDVNQRTLSLGLRWDLRENVALKFQWDNTWIAGNEASLWWNGVDRDTTINLLSTSLNFTY